MLETLFRDRRIFWAVLLALFAIQIAFRSTYEMNHDAAWYLYVAQGLAQGKAMYRDFMEVNPPLAAWETLPVAWIANGTGLSMALVFNAMMFALTAGSVALAGRYLARLSGFTPPLLRLALVLCAAALLFFPGGSFGEREHILSILVLPWLLMRAARAEGARFGVVEAVQIGIVAALGFCLKPHTLLAPLAVEVALALVRRNVRGIFSAENWAAGLTAVFYVVAIKLFTPEFFTVMLPLALRAYVPFIGLDRVTILLGGLGAAGTLVLSAMLYRLSGGGSRALVAAFLAAAVGFLAAYYLQAKGFSYQMLPALVFAALSGLAILPQRASDAAPPKLRRNLAVPLAAVLVAANVHGQSYLYLGRIIDDLVAKVRPGATSVFVATTNLSLGFPAVTRGGYTWGSRFPAQWLAPYVSTVWQSGDLPPDDIAIQALSWNVTDLINTRPDIVFVDTANDQAYVPGGTFDYIGFWSLDPRFAAFWQDYELRQTFFGLAVYVRR